MSEYQSAVQARLAHNVVIVDEGTGGGCRALIIRKAGSAGAVYITNGDLHTPTDASDAEAIYYPDEDNQDAWSEITDVNAHHVAEFANLAL